MIALATRGSALALAQTGTVLAALRQNFPQLEFEAAVIDSDGDLSPEAQVPDLPGTGWFTSRLEQELQRGRVSGAVHSAKDLPTVTAPGLVVAAYLERADPRDAIVTAGCPWGELPAGSRVGTSSPRRVSQMRALRPDLELVAMRGNVDSRVRQVRDGRLEAVVVALAGLERLGRGSEGQPLDPIAESTPAPAQGAIAIEVREGSELEQLATSLDHPMTRLCVEAEREVLSRLGGSCLLPLGAYARPAGPGRAELIVSWGSQEGTPSIRRLRREAEVGELRALAAQLAGELQ